MTTRPGTALAAPTFVAMTLNVWGEHHAAEREPALRELLRVRPPDLLATQELRPWSRRAIDEELPMHRRVDDDFPGWECQSNLWWRTDLFELVEHGATDVGILDDGARLFWVRLRTSADAGLVFSTAHLTWPGHELERTSRLNQRTPQAEAVVAALDELTGGAGNAGACIFTVDINDIGPPLWALGNGGFVDSFTALHRHSPVTHPITPDAFADGVATRLSPLASPAKAIDWIFARGPLAVRSSEVVEFFRRGIAPSDHAPVVATYTVTAD